MYYNYIYLCNYSHFHACNQLINKSSCSTVIFDGDDNVDVDVDDVNTGDDGDDACPDYEKLNYNSRKRNRYKNY